MLFIITFIFDMDSLLSSVCLTNKDSGKVQKKKEIF